MGWIIGVIIALVVIAAIIDEITTAGLWEEIFFGIVLITTICLWRHFDKKERARKSAEREAQQAKEERQLSIRRQSHELIIETEAIVNKLPSNIDAGERALDGAEVEFREGAFDPFWDAIERAINHLGYFDRDVRNVADNSKRHRMLIADLEKERPVFNLAINNLPDARKTWSRLQSIVREAQKNYHFASIYHKRKTNQILVAGFGSLEEALNNMSYRIEESISCLSDTISVSFEKQGDILREQSRDIKVAIESEGGKRQEDERKERDILDNIRRQKKLIL